MRTIRSLAIEDLEKRSTPTAVGSIPFVGASAPAEPAWDHNPNMQDVNCITDPCPPLFEPGFRKDKLGFEWGSEIRSGWKHHDIQGLDATSPHADGTGNLYEEVGIKPIRLELA